MTYRTPVTEADLHAYVDGELSTQRRHEVEEHLLSHPKARAELEDYRRINQGLHQVFDPVLDEALPAQLVVQPMRRARMLRVAAVAAWMMLGGSVGWLLHSVTTPTSIVTAPLQQDLVKPAAFAHAIYSTEIRHPVEVSADHEQHLVAWLSKRLNTELQAPNLAMEGYTLVGGRLLPSTDRMAAQFMYERKDGLRVTLYVRHGVWDNQATSFRSAYEGNLGVFYWIDGPLGYALVGELNHNDLLALSEVIYQQLH